VLACGTLRGSSRQEAFLAARRLAARGQNLSLMV
jgi:hypothetical protein